MGRRYCVVPGCGSTSTKMPNKRFVAVPKNPDRRKAWLEAIKTKIAYSSKATLYCCEDHFIFEEDCANWIQQQYYEYARDRIILKPDAVPHIFKNKESRDLSEQSPPRSSKLEKCSKRKNALTTTNSNCDIPHQVIESPENEPECIVPHRVDESLEKFCIPAENILRTTDNKEGANIKVEIDPEDIIIAFHDENMLSANYADETNDSCHTETTVSVFEDNCSEDNCTVPERPLPFITTNDIQWRRSEIFIRKSLDYESIAVKEKLFQPIKYFEKYLPTFLFERIAAETNLQVCENKMTNFELTSATEIKALFGLFIYMGNFNMDQIDAFWDLSFHSGLFSKTMSLSRFMQLCDKLQTVSTSESVDGLHKARPFLDWISAGCVRLPIEENLCLSKQWIPFIGEPCVKGDNPGLNVYLLCGKSGFVYNFLVHQGGTAEGDVLKVQELGPHAASALSLVERIPKNIPHKLCFNNSFTSYNLLKACSERDIAAVGTISPESSSELPFLGDEEMKSSGKCCDQLCSEDGEVVVVKWRVGEGLVFGSNFVGSNVVEKVTRYDKVTKTFINVDKPEVAKVYEDCMTGAELVVYLLGLYKTYVLSTDAIWRLILFTVDLAMVNCWLEYKKESKSICHKKKVLPLQHFRINVAMALANVGESLPAMPPVRENVPLELRFDMIGHFPKYSADESPGPCKMPGCDKRPFLQCAKCEVPLCFKRGRNCFRLFHME